MKNYLSRPVIAVIAKGGMIQECVCMGDDEVWEPGNVALGLEMLVKIQEQHTVGEGGRIDGSWQRGRERSGR